MAASSIASTRCCRCCRSRWRSSLSEDVVSDRRMRLCILGATGSVGANTLDVVARHPQRYEVTALSAHSRLDALADLCVRWRPRFAAVPAGAPARELRTRLREAG